MFPLFRSPLYWETRNHGRTEARRHFLIKIVSEFRFSSVLHHVIGRVQLLGGDVIAQQPCRLWSSRTRPCKSLRTSTGRSEIITNYVLHAASAAGRGACHRMAVQTPNHSSFSISKYSIFNFRNQI